MAADDRFIMTADRNWKLAEIAVTFNPEDMPAGTADDVSVAFTIEAQRWSKANSGRLATLPPPKIRVLRVSDLPPGTRVLIEDDLDNVVVLFDEYAITAAGAQAWEEFLIWRSETWRRRDGG
jgi:hypothetical protein